jgi:EAL domain-containing protein (putative c-di-GMP-specific phosphodiesterase class I)
VVNISTSAMVGVEALLRWDHPTWGPVPPGDFIAVAEESGQICELGMHVLEVSCRSWRSWERHLAQDPRFSVSVNVSPRQLRDPDFAAQVRAVLAATGVPPPQLVLEITENFMFEQPENAHARLRELKQLGVRISIDDFGTGYSSLASLQALPLDILKIDKAFVDHIADDPRRAAFAQAIIRLGTTLGLELIAEGVETRAQSERLESLGCRLAQGFHFFRPVTPDAVTSLLRSRPTTRRLSARAGAPTAVTLRQATAA